MCDRCLQHLCQPGSVCSTRGPGQVSPPTGGGPGEVEGAGGRHGIPPQQRDDVSSWLRHVGASRRWERKERRRCQAPLLPRGCNSLHEVIQYRAAGCCLLWAEGRAAVCGDPAHCEGSEHGRGGCHSTDAPRTGWSRDVQVKVREGERGWVGEVGGGRVGGKEGERGWVGE
eukprot:763291-Hanusia_phi.AAC.1